MGGGGKGAGKYRGAIKILLIYVQSCCTGSAIVWDKNLVVHGRNDDGTGSFHHRISIGIEGMTVQSVNGSK